METIASSYGAMVVYLIQLFGAVAIGGFIGEFRRAVVAETTFDAKMFLAEYLSGSFLAFILGYLFFYITDNKPISLVIGASLSYQDHHFLNNLIRSTLQKIINQNVDKGFNEKSK